MEQVPCRYDKAEFPIQNVPKVAIDDFNVDISQLKINKISLDSGQFRSIYMGGDGYMKEIGQMMFKVNFIYKYHLSAMLIGYNYHK